MTEFQAKLLLWGLIIVLFLIVKRIARWSHKVQKQAFDKAVEDAVKKELDKRETTNAIPKEPRPGSDAHYEAWRAERMKKESRE